MYGRFAPSSGRGEIRPKNDALERKIHKRRRRGEKFDRRLIVGRRGSSEETDDEPSPTEPTAFQQPPPPQEVGYLTSLFTFIERHPNAPVVLIKYLQLAFNAAVLFGVLYMILSFWLTIQSDVNKAADQAASLQIAEIRACSNDFVRNGCNSETRPPAMASMCDNWEMCMHRDANAVRRAALSAHTFATILNSFVEPISVKTLVRLFILFLIRFILHLSKKLLQKI